MKEVLPFGCNFSLYFIQCLASFSLSITILFFVQFLILSSNADKGLSIKPSANVCLTENSNVNYFLFLVELIELMKTAIIFYL